MEKGSKKTQEDMETISWTSDEGENAELGRGDKTSEGQATLTFIGQGLYVRTRMKGIYYNHN